MKKLNRFLNGQGCFPLTIGIALLFIFVIGCGLRQATRKMDKHREYAAGYCVSRFPPKDSVREVINVKKGKMTVKTDTAEYTSMQYVHDTAFGNKSNKPSLAKTITKYITIERTKTDTVTVDKVTVRESGAGAVLLAKVNLLEANYKIAKSRYVAYKSLLICLITLLILYCVYRITKHYL